MNLYPFLKVLPSFIGLLFFQGMNGMALRLDLTLHTTIFLDSFRVGKGHSLLRSTDRPECTV